jgi:hypothetical protein
MNMTSLDSLQVLINDHIADVPRLRVNQRFAELMPREFVDELQAWMTKQFGTQPQIIRMGGSVFMNQRTFDKMMRDLKQAAAEARR